MTPSPLHLRALAGPLLVAGATTALVFGAGLVAGHALFPALAVAPPSAPVAAAPPPAPAATGDSCGLPPGIPIDALDPAERSFALRRGFLCADLAAGRIDLAGYRDQLARLDRARSHQPEPTGPATDIVWASAVRAYSSQYTDSEWSAARALGAPDVPAGGGDHPNAWASEGADDRPEFLEVGFDRPRRIDGADILETHNAGAVTRVELIASDGTRSLVYSAAPAAVPAPFRRHIDLACTDKPIAALRVTLDSTAVPDWNEIDAIGIHPCP